MIFRLTRSCCVKHTVPYRSKHHEQGGGQLLYIIIYKRGQERWQPLYKNKQLWQYKNNVILEATTYHISVTLTSAVTTMGNFLQAKCFHAFSVIYTSLNFSSNCLNQLNKKIGYKLKSMCIYIFQWILLKAFPQNVECLNIEILFPQKVTLWYLYIYHVCILKCVYKL